MNVDHILQTAKAHGVDYLLIGGMNFLLSHAPILTYGVDLWIEDSQDNRTRCETFLAALDFEWGVSDDDWGMMSARPAGWLLRQSIFCLTSPHGAIDIFREVGLFSWKECRQRAVNERTAKGVIYFGLADQGIRATIVTDEEKAREEERREAHWDPQERCRVIEETITWADAQKTGGRNLRENRLREQARKLRDLDQGT